MKFDVVKISASLIVILALLMCSSVATETTWRHSGFELWGYDINFTDHNASNIYLLHADYLHGDCSNVTNLNASNITSGEIPLSQIPNTLTGKDADTLDGYHAVDLLSATNISSGSYAGNDTANRAIAHGLGKKPLIVMVSNSDQPYWQVLLDDGYTLHVSSGSASRFAVTAKDATNFYVGNAGDYTQSINHAGYTYYWVALA